MATRRVSANPAPFRAPRETVMMRRAFPAHSGLSRYSATQPHPATQSRPDSAAAASDGCRAKYKRSKVFCVADRAPPTAHSARRVSPAPAPRSQSSARRDTSPRRAKQTAPPALRATSARHDCTERLNAVPRATTHLSARSSASSAQRAPSAPTSPLASRRKRFSSPPCAALSRNTRPPRP
jgi:hypothetical protein